jgi:hypothetical protein
LKALLADLAVMLEAQQHMLLSQSAVQDELRLSADQADRLKAVFRSIIERGPVELRDLPRVSVGERSQQLLREMKAHQKAIGGILTPIQLTRLGQIAL